MAETQIKESYAQRVHRLSGLSGKFLTAWAEGHTGMKDIGLLPFDPQVYPFQAIDHHKSTSFASRHEVDLEAYRTLLEHNLVNSFEDPAKVEPFVRSMGQPYPYPGGNGRSYTEVLVEDFLSRGLSVAPTLGHPEDRLTDAPRFAVSLALNLDNKYGAEYLQDIGLVAGAPLKLETYKDHPVDEMLSITSDVYYTNTKSDNANAYRMKAGLTEEELLEVSTFMNLGFGRILMRDSRPKRTKDGEPVEHGHAIIINPTATRAIIERGAEQQIESITLPSADPNTGRLMGGFGAYWPAVVIGDEIKLGPIIRLDEAPKKLSKEECETLYLQRVEDSMDIVASLISEVLGKKDAAQYLRTTKPGEIHGEYFRRGGASVLGGKALEATYPDRYRFDVTE